MTPFTLKRKDWSPALKDFLRAHGYRKHSVSVFLGETFEVRETHWSEGSRSEYTCRSLAGDAIPLRPENPTGFAGGFRGSDSRDMLPAYVYVVGGVFRGKPAHWMCYMLPQTAQQLGIEVPA